MPVTFHIPGALREFTAGHGRVHIEHSPQTLAEALSALWTIYPGVRDRIATEQGQVREHINIFVGDENIRYTGGLASPVPSGCEISIVPAVSGGSSTCHTMGASGKLGFDDRGKEVGKNFEGCISLLTSMNVIAQLKPVNRTAEEKHKAARFQEFGCTTCHQIVPGKLGLTDYGKKLKTLHLACTDVERILAK
jgi:molybdopterin converting factor small subunit